MGRFNSIIHTGRLKRRKPLKTVRRIRSYDFIRLISQVP